MATPGRIWRLQYRAWRRPFLLHSSSKIFLITAIFYANSYRSSKMEAIRNKYRGVKFMKVADLPELKGEVGL